MKTTRTEHHTDPVARGAEFVCSACGDKQLLMLPSHDKQQAELLVWAIVGDERFYMYPPGSTSPVCKSACCRAIIQGRLLGFDEVDTRFDRSSAE